MSKIKIAIVIFGILLICMLVYWLTASNNNYVHKQTVVNKVKSIKCNVTASKGTIRTKPILKQISKYENVKIDTINNIDTLLHFKYMAETDTSINVNDSLGRLRGIVELNAKFISDKPISNYAYFETNYKIKSISYDTFEKETITKVVKESETGLFKNFGLGIFAGGIINNKNIDYGIGFGIVYKITK